MDAGGELNAVVAVASQAGPIGAVHYSRFPSPSTDDGDDCDDLYGDFDLGFLPLPPLSPCPSSPPKTPSPGLFLPSPTTSPSPSPPPRRRTPSPEPEPQPSPAPLHQPPPPLPAPKEPTPQHQPPPPNSPTPQHQAAPNSPTPQHQPPPPAQKPLVWRHQLPQRAPGGAPAPSPSPSTATAALYIGDLPWWTTDAEVEAALAPHGKLRGLYFSADKSSGKSRGHCRAEFLHPAEAASAAAALHGRAFDGHHCVASLSRPSGLHRSDADLDAPAPNPTLGRGGPVKNATTAHGNVAFLGDGSAQGPMDPRPRGFGAMIGGGGAFPSAGECGPMPSMVPPHVNPAFLAANRMAAMCGNGTGPWHDQGMAGGFWGGQQPWNFGGCEMPWQQPMLQQHHRQAQQYRNGDYGKMRSTGRGRPGGRNEDRDSGNVRGNPDRRQCGRGGGKRPGMYNRADRDRRREHVERERNCDERDRRGGEKRRYDEYTEQDDWQRRGRARSSQPRNSDDDDDPRQQSRDSDDDDYPRRRR